MAGKNCFRIVRVRGDLRGQVWYLTYHEHGHRRRPRLGPDREEDVARRLGISAETVSQIVEHQLAEQKAIDPGRVITDVGLVRSASRSGTSST